MLVFELLCLGKFSEYINSIGFSADSKLLLSGSNDLRTRVWSVKSGAKHIDVQSHSKEITVVALGIDFEQSPTIDVTAEVTDSAGNTYQKTLTIELNEVAHERVTGDARDNNIYGGVGDDTYVYHAFDGNDSFHGGADWTDVIELDTDAYNGTDQDIDNPWTITINGSEVEYDLASHALELNPDTSGLVTLADGSELTIDGIERIEW